MSNTKDNIKEEAVLSIKMRWLSASEPYISGTACL